MLKIDIEELKKIFLKKYMLYLPQWFIHIVVTMILLLLNK